MCILFQGQAQLLLSVQNDVIVSRILASTASTRRLSRTVPILHGDTCVGRTSAAGSPGPTEASGSGPRASLRRGGASGRACAPQQELRREGRGAQVTSGFGALLGSLSGWTPPGLARWAARPYILQSTGTRWRKFPKT